MAELRPQLGSTLPDMLTKLMNEDRTATVEFWRILERFSEMGKNDEAFMQEVYQESKDSEIDDLRAQVEALTASVNEAQDTANNAIQAADDAATSILTAAEDAEVFRPTGKLGDLDEVGDDDLRTLRGMIEQGDGPPEVEKSRIYTDTGQSPNVGYIDSGLEILRITPEREEADQTGTATVTNVTNGIVLAKASFTNVSAINRIVITDTAQNEFLEGSGNDSADAVTTKGQLRVFVANDADSTPAIGSALNTGVSLWDGSTTGVNFFLDGGDIRLQGTTDHANARADTTSGVGVDVRVGEAAVFNGSSITVYLLMRVDVGTQINTVTSGGTALMEVYLSGS